MATLQFSEGTNAPTAIHQRRQLLPNLVDGMARTRPGAIYAETPLSPTTYDKGYLKITYRALANAINGVAWLLCDHLGEGTKHDTIVYLGPNDLAYVVVILGATKAGYNVRTCPLHECLSILLTCLQNFETRFSRFPHATPSLITLAFSKPRTATFYLRPLDPILPLSQVFWRFAHSK